VNSDRVLGLGSGDFEAGDFDAGDFDAGDFDAGDFDAGDFDAGDFDAGGSKIPPRGWKRSRYRATARTSAPATSNRSSSRAT
jgi:hypothetical protein